jgi:hypothetical protein
MIEAQGLVKINDFLCCDSFRFYGFLVHRFTFGLLFVYPVLLLFLLWFCFYREA